MCYPLSKGSRKADKSLLNSSRGKKLKKFNFFIWVVCKKNESSNKIESLIVLGMTGQTQIEPSVKSHYMTIRLTKLQYYGKDLNE